MSKTISNTRLTRALAIILTGVVLAGTVAIAEAQEPPPPPRPALAFVVDVSGSMSGTPLQQAKGALLSSIDSLRPDDPASLRSYSGACGQGGQLLVPAGTTNRAQLRDAVNGLVAGGGTPTPEALASAVDDFPATAGRRTLVLVSDGQSSCGDPCPVAATIKERLGVDFKAFTVGFRASDQAEDELSCIAQATGGQYFTASDQASLQQAIADAIGSSGGVPLAQLYGPGGAYARNPSGYVGDPVNTATGAFVASVTDAALYTGAGASEVVRSYTSSDPTVGPLGRGWTHSYAAALSVSETGTVMARAGNGQQVLFDRDPDGGYTGALGSLAQLVKTPDGYTLTSPSAGRETFDDSGRLLVREDRAGRSERLTYDASGRLAGVEVAPGRGYGFVHDAAGLLTRIELPDGRAVGFGYTGGLLTSVTDLAGGTTRYRYGDTGLLTEVRDQNGEQVVANTYGADDRISRQVNGVGAVSTYTWDPATETSVMNDPRGGAWTDVYSGGILASRSDPLGNTTRLEYDGALNLLRSTDPRGNVTGFGYDGSGNLVREQDASGAVTQATFDPAGLPTQVTAPDGGVTTFGYDDADRLTSIEQPGDVDLAYRRDPRGLLTSFVDPLASSVRFEHDRVGDVVATVTPTGSRSGYRYDLAGRLAGVTDPLGRVSTFGFDAADRLVRSVDAMRIATEARYDPAGRLVAVTTGNRRTTTYGWDAAGRLSTVTAADGSLTRHTYDGSGNHVSTRDALGRTTTYIYDAANRRIRSELPGGRVWTYEFDASSNVTSVTDANGNATPDAGDGVTRFTYDGLDRVTAVSYSDDTPDVGYAYNPRGDLVRMTDGAGVQSFAYDAAGRLTEAARGNQVFRYTYDGAGRLTSRRYPSGAITSYAYDGDDRMTALTADGRTTRFTYDAAGNQIRRALPNEVQENLTYDAANRLVGLHTTSGSRTVDRRDLTLDGVGNPVRIRTPRGTDTYAYDAQDRLVRWCPRGVCAIGESYGWDAVGNRTSITTRTRTTRTEYNEADQPIGRGAPAFDRNGNQLQVNGQDADYDLANRLTGLAAGRVPNATAVTVGYDGLGNRLSERIRSPLRRTDVTVGFAQDLNAALPLLAEQTGPEGSITRYTYGDLPESVTAGGGTAHFVRDHLSSTTALVGDRGKVLQTYEYGPFGVEDRGLRLDRGLLVGLNGIEVRVTPEGVSLDLGGAGLGRRDGPARANALTFAGQYWDGALGVSDMRARQYSPASGRFLQRDPLPAPPLTSLASAYSYAEGRPTAVIDPSGEFGLLVTGAIGAGFGLAEYALTTPASERTAGGWAGAAGGGFIGGVLPGVGAAAITARSARTVAVTTTRVVAGRITTPTATVGFVSATRTTTVATLYRSPSRLQKAALDGAGGFTGGVIGDTAKGELTFADTVAGTACAAGAGDLARRAVRGDIAQSLLSGGACVLLKAARDQLQGLGTNQK